jgi:hypothetical protein
MLVVLALGGAANGLLELEDMGAGFIQGGAWVSLLAYPVLGLPALWLAWWVLVTVFRKRPAVPGGLAEPACAADLE